MGADLLCAIEGMRFAYSGKAVLDITSLSIRKNKITVLIGDNGCGKTTLLKLLNGLLSPGSGEIRYSGSGIKDRANLGKKMVLVHQDPYLFSSTVLKNVAYGLKIRKYPKRHTLSKVKESLQLVGLAGFESRRSRDLSGGEKRRVAIARALAIEPEVIFIDEPTSSIDTNSIKLIEESLVKLAGKGTTVVISSHNYNFAYRVGDEFVFMEQGKIVPPGINIFKGKACAEKNGFTLFKTGEVILNCPIQQGDFKAAVLPKHDVILSETAVITSARNQLLGTVKSITQNDCLFEITMDCGIEIDCLITESSYKKLQIKKGLRLFATFKASALKLY